MKRKTYNIFFTIIMASLLMNNLFAQTDHKVVREFNELKAYLTKIWIVVQRFDNQQARNLMEQAKQEMETAEDLIFNRRYVLAKLHMLKARNFGNKAAKIVLSQPVKRLKKQLDDLINNAENNQSNTASDESRYLLNQAKKFRNFAYNALEKGRINKAQEYYRIAFYFADKSLNMSNRGSGDAEIQIAELKSNIDVLFSRVEELVNQNKQFSHLVNEARKHYADAMQLLDTGRINLARKKLILIEKLLFRIIDQVDRSSSNRNERLENDLYSMKAFLEALARDAEESKNQRVDIFLNRANKQFTEAKEAYESGRLEIANTKLNLSQRFASKALKLMKTGSDVEIANLDSRLNDNKRLLELQKEQVEKSGNKRLLKLHKEAEKLTNKATELNQQKNQKAALLNLQLSTRLMNNIQRQLDYNQNEEITQVNEIQNKINRTEIILNKLKSNRQLQPGFQGEIEQLENLFGEATQYFEKQQYEITNEYLDYILQQINRLSNKWSQQTK